MPIKLTELNWNYQKKNTLWIQLYEINTVNMTHLNEVERSTASVTAVEQGGMRFQIRHWMCSWLRFYTLLPKWTVLGISKMRFTGMKCSFVLRGLLERLLSHCPVCRPASPQGPLGGLRSCANLGQIKEKNESSWLKGDIWTHAFTNLKH